MGFVSLYKGLISACDFKSLVTPNPNFIGVKMVSLEQIFNTKLKVDTFMISTDQVHWSTGPKLHPYKSSREKLT